MLKVFLSYARADGSAAATRLRAELEAMGFTVWRDIEDLQGGLPWREQLRLAVRNVDAVLVLLTPAAVASAAVTWEWETAQTLGRRVIGLLIASCLVAGELQRLHYHDLHDDTTYALGLAKLGRDLCRLEAGRAAPPAPAASGSTYQVNTSISSAIGDGALTINQGGALASQDLARLLAVLRTAGRRADPEAQAELQVVLQELQAEVSQANTKLDRLAEGQERLRAHYDAGEQRLLATLLERANAQELALSNAIMNALDRHGASDGALAGHLAAIAAALDEIQACQATIADRQLAETAGQVAELIRAPELSVKHKLKLTIPLIPLLLDYEGELELDNGLNLEEAWRWLRGLVPRKRQGSSG
jgi:hypothetical protein